MCDSVCAARSELPVDARAPSMARALVDAPVCRERDGGLRGPARLLVSELVTNAVRHGAGPIVLEVDCDQDAGMAVRVSDGGPGRPLQRRSLRDGGDRDGHGGTGGWGLAFVDLISDAWGVDDAGRGKVVWFRLRRSTWARVRVPQQGR